MFKDISKERVKVNNTKGFKYDPESHLYTVDGTKLKNTTSWIEGFKKPFESFSISQAVANSNKKKNTGISDANKLRAYWKAKGNHSKNVGSSFHEFAYLYWLDPVNSKPKTNYDKIAIAVMNNIKSKYDIIEMEVPRGSRTYMMGFTMDIVMRRKTDGVVVLGDFKTNEFATAEQYKKVKGRLPGKLIAPFDDLRDVCLHTASIQLNAYKILNNSLPNKLFNIDECVIIHVNPDPEYYGDKGYRAYKTIDIYNTVSFAIDKEKNYKMEALSII